MPATVQYEFVNYMIVYLITRRVVVTALSASHLVTHQQHRRPDRLANTLKLAPPGTRVAPSGKLLPSWPIMVFIRPCLGVCDDLLCLL